MNGIKYWMQTNVLNILNQKTSGRLPLHGEYHFPSHPRKLYFFLIKTLMFSLKTSHETVSSFFLTIVLNPKSWNIPPSSLTQNLQINFWNKTNLEWFVDNLIFHRRSLPFIFPRQKVNLAALLCFLHFLNFFASEIFFETKS